MILEETNYNLLCRYRSNTVILQGKPREAVVQSYQRWRTDKDT